jgi:hypothetical protein
MTLPASGAISFSNINVELCRSSTAQLSLNDSCLRTLFGQASGVVCMNTGHGKTNTSVPGAPTSVSGSATSSSAISVSFSAPGCTGHLAIDYYQAISSPGCFTATAASSPISVTGLSAATSYTFRVRAHNSKGYGCYSSSSGTITTQASRGCAVYTTPGSYTWTAPAGVTSVSVLFIGSGAAGRTGFTYYCCCQGQISVGGQGGGGGGAGAANQYPTTPGTGYSVKVGAPGPACANYFTGTSSFLPYVAPKMTQTTGGLGNAGGGNDAGYGHGGYGGSPSAYNRNYGIPGGGGGGAAANPFTSCGGGSGGACGSNGYQGQSTGSAGGGAGGLYYTNATGAGGGGVGLYGLGSTGSGGTIVSGYPPNPGGGGSGGNSGSGSTGGAYGGGGGGTGYPANTGAGQGASGAVRIVWPGSSRQFPSTDVGA